MYVHTPVLLEEVLHYLQCGPGKLYIDCTIGEAGHAEQILEKSSPNGELIGLDRDQEILKKASERLEKYGHRVHLIQDTFKNIKTIISELGFVSGDGLLIDLGISTFHFQSPERGFSLQFDGPLDMRLDQRNSLTAAKIVNQWEEKELSRIFWQYGEERWSRQIARSICSARQERPLETTGELAELAKSAIPAKYQSRRIHPATKIFQALRIVVNEELTGLDQVLADAVEVLKPGARLCVISFHSLEDRIVKRSFRRLSHGAVSPIWGGEASPKLKLITKKPIVPSQAELAQNWRARSAKLRVAERC